MKLRIVAGLFTLILFGAAFAADNAPDVRDLMTANQFHATGLDARSAEQLTAFDAWLASYTRPAAAGPVDVRDLMSARQFHATGLDMLSLEQVTAFNAWLAGYARPGTAGSGTPSATVAAPATPAIPVPTPAPAVPTPTPAASTSANAFGQQMLAPEKREEPKRIESTIVGHFTGWNGATVFTLANGQVWKQAGAGYLQVNLQDPPVVIKRLVFGYLLTLPGQGDTVFVTRVK